MVLTLFMSATSRRDPFSVDPVVPRTVVPKEGLLRHGNLKHRTSIIGDEGLGSPFAWNASLFRPLL